MSEKLGTKTFYLDCSGLIAFNLSDLDDGECADVHNYEYFEKGFGINFPKGKRVVKVNITIDSIEYGNITTSFEK
jgi:hypothetical protein